MRHRSQIVLAAMAAGRPRARYDAVQLQKLLFLIDREAADMLNGPFFDFQPHHYGPFDKAVYEAVKTLIARSQVREDTGGRYVRYALTNRGREAGMAILTGLPEPASRYMSEVASWVLTVSFYQLLSAVYSRYPDMAVNSVVTFRRRPYMSAEYGFPMPSFASGMARTLDFMGVLDEYPVETDGDHRDFMAIYRDWRAVGDDLRAAIARVADQVRTP